MTISTLFRMVLEHVYVTTSILMALEMDILYRLYGSKDVAESWSCVDPAFLSLLWMKSANLSGVAGLLLFLRTE
jgi:hypothetical protein